MKKNKKEILKNHGYSMTGGESGVKLCKWVGEKLSQNEACYKEKFYGINSHRCLQMSPVLDACNQACLFCWRYQDFQSFKNSDFDDPKTIVKKSLEAQKKLVSGYGGESDVPDKLWEEAKNPKHVAISLSGEPTLYPDLSELIYEYEKRGMTTFLVTNGTRPKVLESLDTLPTQLYVTLAAPNKQIYEELCLPKSERLWERLNETLEKLDSLNTRKVVRLTLVDKWNIGWEDEYAKLLEMANPDFIEAKGYVCVGDSRRRMTLENMPSHDKIRGFSKKISEFLNLEVLDEKQRSRVALIGKKNSKKSIE